MAEWSSYDVSMEAKKDSAVAEKGGVKLLNNMTGETCLQRSLVQLSKRIARRCCGLYLSNLTPYDSRSAGRDFHDGAVAHWLWVRFLKGEYKAKRKGDEWGECAQRCALSES